MPRTPGYATRQRSLVLECLKAHAGQYLSVADIAADLTKKGSPVGVTTIYRALEKLASEGTVRHFVPDTVIQGLCSDCLTKTQKPAHSTGQCACGHHH